MERIRRRAFVPYKEAFEEFTSLRKKLNDLAEEDKEKFQELFNDVKIAASRENTVAMDLLAYYYKTGVEGLVEENYSRFIQWELLAAARGNEFAIEKLQFLIGYACDIIIEDESYQTIEYKNDIDDENLLYVLGKAIAKIYVREYKVFPVDVYELKDEFNPYKQEYFINLRKKIDDIIPKTIEFLKS